MLVNREALPLGYRLLLSVIATCCCTVAMGAMPEEATADLVAAQALPGATGSTIRPVVVAVVDDGVDVNHSTLSGFVWHNPNEIPDNNIDDDHNGLIDDVTGWDFADGDANVAPPFNDLSRDHGTYLAGLITRYAQHVFGAEASTLIQVLPVKVLANSSTDTALISGYRGIAYARDMGADIILAAWSSPTITAEEAGVVQSLADGGSLLIAASGNLGTESPMYPAAHPAALAVAALAGPGRLPISNYGGFVDLAAPGLNVASITAGDASGGVLKSGTSPAAAIVAAASSVLWAQYPKAGGAKLRACLMATATPVPQLSEFERGRLGAGALNVRSAKECLDGTVDHSGQIISAPKGYLFASSNDGAQPLRLQPAGIFSGGVLQILDSAYEQGDDFRVLVNSGRRQKRLRPGDRVPLANNADVVEVQVSGAESLGEPIAYFEFEPRVLQNRFCTDLRVITEPGVIADGSGAESYAPGSDCKWLIKAPPGNQIVLSFTRLDTELQRDLVYVFAGPKTNAPIAAIVSGGVLPDAPIKPPGSEVLVWFVSDLLNESAGFEVEVRFAPLE